MLVKLANIATRVKKSRFEDVRHDLVQAIQLFWAKGSTLRKVNLRHEGSLDWWARRTKTLNTIQWVSSDMQDPVHDSIVCPMPSTERRVDGASVLVDVRPHAVAATRRGRVSLSGRCARRQDPDDPEEAVESRPSAAVSKTRRHRADVHPRHREMDTIHEDGVKAPQNRMISRAGRQP